jgi:hypothetical protein
MTPLLLDAIVAGLALAAIYGSSQQDSVAARSAAAQGNLCALLTEAEAEAIVGKPLAAPELQPGGDCWYPETAGGGGGGEIMLHVFPYRFDSREKFHAFLVKEVKAADDGMREAMEGTGATVKETAVEPVPEIEAPAYYADPTLFVLKGGKVLAIAAVRPHAVAAAAKALPRFR